MIEPRFEFLHARDAGEDARRLGVELGDRLLQGGGLLCAFLHRLELLRHCIELGVQLDGLGEEAGHALGEGFDRLAM